MNTEVQAEGPVRGDGKGGVGEIPRELTERMDGVDMLEGTACPDRIHMCLRIAPKHAASGVVGKLKGKSAIILHERHPELRRVTGGAARCGRGAST